MVDFLLEHWSDFFGVLGVIGAGCTAVVKFFGNVKWASTLVKICDNASIVNTPANKAILEKYSKKNK